jgi:hypothetical protein
MVESFFLINTACRRWFSAAPVVARLFEIAAQDARAPEVLKTCKTPPPSARGFDGPGRGASPPPKSIPSAKTIDQIPLLKEIRDAK